MSKSPQNLVQRLMKGDLFKHGVAYGISSIAQSATGFLVLPILANQLATTDFGIFSLIQMVIVFAQSTFFMGITSALQRSFYDHPEGDARNEVYSTSFYLSFFGALALFVGAWLFSPWLSLRVIGTDQYGGEIFWGLCSSCLFILNQFFLTALRLEKRSAGVAWIGILGLLIQVIAAWFLVAWMKRGLMGAVGSLVITQASLFIPLYYLGRRSLRVVFSTNEAKLQLAYGIPALLAGFAFVFIDWSDRLVIQKFLPMSEVAVYSLSYRMSSAINVLMITPFALVWSPLMMEKRTSPDIGPLTARVFALYCGIGAIVLAFGTLSMTTLLPLFVTKNEYRAAFPIVPYIMCGYLFYGLTNLTTAGLSFARKLMPLVLTYYSVAVLRFGLNMLVVPRFGYLGSAYVALASYAILPGTLYYFSRKHFSHKLPWSSCLALLTSTAASAYGVSLLNTFGLGPRSLLPFLVAVASGLWILRSQLPDRRPLTTAPGEAVT